MTIQTLRSGTPPAVLAVALVLALGCSTRQVHEEPILENGDRVASVDARRIGAQARAERNETVATRTELMARALAGCEPRICEAVTRGEVALGMTETQVLAATRTTGSAWRTRQSGPAAVMVPRSPGNAPEDAVASLAMVQLRNGRVASYGYRETQGVRLVDERGDATTQGRARALAEMLIQEGDELAAAGRLDAALARYDRADVLRANDPLIDYRIATVLDKQLRPIRALIRYKLFLHRLELERIEAIGKAYGNLAHAIAHAEKRIVVLEKRTQ